MTVGSEGHALELNLFELEGCDDSNIGVVQLKAVFAILQIIRNLMHAKEIIVNFVETLIYLQIIKHIARIGSGSNFNYTVYLHLIH